jgi:hypothetical protein
LPMETTGVLGSLAGIGELAREAMGGPQVNGQITTRPAPAPTVPRANG